MKKRSDKQITLIIAIISAITLVFMTLFWKINVTSLLVNINKTMAILFTLLAFILTMASICLLIASFEILIITKILEVINKKNEKEYITRVQVVKDRLSREPSYVRLKNPEDSTFIEGIPNEDIEFLAHLDENDNIILTFQVNNAKLEISDYDWFLTRFNF